MVVILLLTTGCRPGHREIRLAITTQLEHYPESRLQDIYKSFFQDECGPGHFIEDISSARKYFDLELEEMVPRGRHEPEPCGVGKNFYRIPMDLVKEGIMSEDEYFQAFIASSRDFSIPDIGEWIEKWNTIETELKKMKLHIPDMDNDKKAIDKSLSDGNAVFHHSQKYTDAYDPHYRIMAKEQWEKLKSSIRDQ